ncbi:MAG: hypothetical protein IIZ63_09265 [Caulobacteraceae bacterium]|nr:hypothetical protein [Caulobacteraceae bacterium]
MASIQQSLIRTAAALSALAALAALAACKPAERSLASVGVRTLQPVSTTAKAVTGELALSKRALSFADDLTYQTGAVHVVPASEDYGKGGGTWAALLKTPPSAKVEIRAVTSETVGAQAEGEGLCGKNKTTHLALVEGRSPRGAPALHVIAFKGWGSPGPYDDPDSLCGVFTYAAQAEPDD